LAVVSQANDKRLTVPLLLGICYAASIGGMGTPIGTAPNIAYISIYKEYFDKDTGFLQWMTMTIPLVLILLPVVGFWLTRNLTDNTEVQLPHAGKWRTIEVRTLLVFGFIACAWIFRQEPFGGWQTWFNLPNASDANVAILGVVLLFMLPSGEGPGKKLLDWQSAVKIPWGILLLFSGGLVIASAFKSVGLSQALGTQLSYVMQFHPFIIILATCLLVTFLTEVTSNTASTLLLLPIIAEIARVSEVIENPAMIMIPATISASCAFMLPVATPPNAIIFGSGKYRHPCRDQSHASPTGM
jgi:sodium-dependent dicarboxylate transporter 2/3/5